MIRSQLDCRSQLVRDPIFLGIQVANKFAP